MNIGQERIIKRFAVFPTWVWVGEQGDKDKWIWLRPFYEKQNMLNGMTGRKGLETIGKQVGDVNVNIFKIITYNGMCKYSAI